MKKLVFLAFFLMLGPVRPAAAISELLHYGPLAVTVPLQTVDLVYQYDFHNSRNLIGGETKVVSLWNKIEGVGGLNTTLQGRGVPYVAGNVVIGNLFDKWISLPNGLKISGTGGYDFNKDTPIYGLKAGITLW